MSRITEYQNKKRNNLAKSFLDNSIVRGGIWTLMSKLETQGGLEIPRGANQLSYKALGLQSSQILSNGKRKRNKENIHSDDIRTWNNQQQWFHNGNLSHFTGIARMYYKHETDLKPLFWFVPLKHQKISHPQNWMPGLHIRQK